MADRNSRVFLWAALLLLVLPLRWLIAALVAALVHEGGHFLTIYLLGGKVHGTGITARGAVIQTGQMGYARELICALTGPAASLLLCLFSRWVPLIALCGLGQGLYNLLPVFPLDGGRAVRCIAGLICREPERTAERIQWVCLSLLILVSIVLGIFRGLGLWMPILTLLLTVNALMRKNSLQTGASGVTIDLPF